jgi:PAS domain S-box-containing protein
MNDQICLIDRDGQVGLCNDEMCRFLGLPPDQIAGRRCSALMGIAEEDAVHMPISLMLASGKRESSELALQDQWFSVTADPIRNEAGAIIGGVQILRNITEKKEAEEAVRAGEETLRSILDSTGEAIYGVDAGDRCTFLNPACLRLLGYPKKEDLLGHRMHPLIHYRHPDGTEYPAEACPVVRSLATGEGCHIDNEVFSRADGSVFPVEISTSPQWKDGKLAGAVVAFSDISARKRLEAEMVQSLQEKEVLLKEIHHRVKNNIQVISSILSLQSNQATDPATREIFRETQNKVRGIALIHEKLYRSRSFSRINYEEYLKDIANHTFQSYTIDPGQVGLRIDAGGVAIDIGKAVPLSLIVTELLSNALKHGFPDGRKGEIAIAIRPVDRNLVLTFSDNGIGLPETVSFDKGDTLGMRLLAGLTRQLSGTIAVDRTGGTAFTITFPVSDEESGALPADPGRVPVANSG